MRNIVFIGLVAVKVTFPEASSAVNKRDDAKALIWRAASASFMELSLATMVSSVYEPGGICQLTTKVSTGRFTTRRVIVKAKGGWVAVMLYMDDGTSARKTSISRTPRRRRGRVNV